MTDGVEEAIRRILVERHAVPARRVRPDARLVEDIGLDGDDAVEFVQEIERKFGTDLSGLHRDWHCRFGPEGLGWRAGLGAFVAPAIVLALLLARSTVAESWAALVTVGVAASLCWLLARRSRCPAREPITIADIADAVRRGAWQPRGVTAQKPSGTPG